MPGKLWTSFTLIALWIIALCLSGCAAGDNRQAEARSKAKAFYTKGTNRVYRRGGSYALVTPGVKTVTVTPVLSNMSSEERSQIIAAAVTELDAVISASAVITGNTAIVGVQTDAVYDDSELIEIKRLVEEKVKAADKGIDHVSVTAAEDLVERINNMPDAGLSDDPLVEPGDFVPRG